MNPLELIKSKLNNFFNVNQTDHQKNIEASASASITSDTKITESTEKQGNFRVNLMKYTNNAIGIKTEIDRNKIMDPLKQPLNSLHNDRLKLRLVNGELTTKKRSFFTIESAVGGAKSKEAVEHVFIQLATASTMPKKNDPPISEVLDQLLDNRWLCKTIENDKTGDLKTRLLKVLARETEADPPINPIELNKLLAKLDAKIPQISENGKFVELKKYANKEIKKEEFQSLLSQLKFEDINKIANHELVKNNEFTNKILDVLAKAIIEDPNTKAHEQLERANQLNPLLQKLGLCNEFQEKLMDHALELAQKRGSDNYHKQYDKVQDQYMASDNEITEEFLYEYHQLMKLLDVTYKVTFGPQYANTHDEVMESLKTHHYVIEKSEDKFFYHIDTIGLDGKRDIKKGKLDDSTHPEDVKRKLDDFISKVHKGRLPPK